MKGATEQAKSADYKIVKLQSGIGFVKKLLNDRKNASASVMKLDKESVACGDEPEKEEEPFGKCKCACAADFKFVLFRFAML